MHSENTEGGKPHFSPAEQLSLYRCVCAWPCLWALDAVKTGTKSTGIELIMQSKGAQTRSKWVCLLEGGKGALGPGQ